jgi:signal recognition particle subunit SRP54
MTKLDGDARGGAALSNREDDRQTHQTRLCRRKGRDIEEFTGPDGFPHSGMGDVLTLIEKASEALDEKRARRPWTIS